MNKQANKGVIKHEKDDESSRFDTGRMLVERSRVGWLASCAVVRFPALAKVFAGWLAGWLLGQMFVLLNFRAVVRAGMSAGLNNLEA